MLSEVTKLFIIDIKCSEVSKVDLVKLLKGMLCHVNLIPVNEVAESPFKPSSPQQVERFVEILSKKGINATVRRKLGSDIDASCGQLRLKENKVRNKGG